MFRFHVASKIYAWSRGPMDKAPDYGSGDCNITICVDNILFDCLTKNLYVFNKFFYIQISG